MTDPHPFAKGQLRREAADWFLRMRDPGSEAHRAEFEEWLARGALHRAAYNSIKQVYMDGAAVNWENIPRPRRVRGTVHRTRFAIAATVMLVGFLGWRLVSGGPMLPQRMGAIGETARIPAQVATRLGEIRQVRLPDGSRLTLDTDTLVSVAFDRRERELRIEHGRARFEVAHENRPFIVAAAETEVVAHGTVFDVSLVSGGDVDVHLLSGSVAVRRHRETRPQAMLRPGDALRVGRADGRLKPPVPDDADSTRWPNGLADFSRAPLGEVIAAANRYSTLKLRLSEPRLARIRVSGVLRINEPEALAVSLVRLFGLRATRSGNEILLSPE